MRLCVLDYFRARHLRKRLGGVARCAGKPDARFAAILCEYFTEGLSFFRRESTLRTEGALKV